MGNIGLSALRPPLGGRVRHTRPQVRAGCRTGTFYRLRIDPKTGLSTAKDKLLTLDGRKILGLAFDPEATAHELVAWITYDDRNAEQVDAGTFSGVISRLVIPVLGQSGGAKETQYIMGLPSGWHLLDGGTFGPDRRLYGFTSPSAA